MKSITLFVFFICLAVSALGQDNVQNKQDGFTNLHQLSLENAESLLKLIGIVNNKVNLLESRLKDFDTANKSFLADCRSITDMFSAIILSALVFAALIFSILCALCGYYLYTKHQIQKIKKILKNCEKNSIGIVVV